jgi:hypothetical protein
MQVSYVRRAQGSLRAVATLAPAQREAMRSQEKGSAAIAVKVTDDSGEEPIQCEFVWAWVPKKK